MGTLWVARRSTSRSAPTVPALAFPYMEGYVRLRPAPEVPGPQRHRLTFFWAADTYAATITRISEDGQRIWFTQDKPIKRTRGLGAPFLFVADPEAPEFEARLEGGAYVLAVEGHRRPVELGVRRWYTTPLALRRR